MYASCDDKVNYYLMMVILVECQKHDKCLSLEDKNIVVRVCSSI